jgi:hypothetical protein
MKLSSIILENPNIDILLTKEEIRKVSTMVIEGYDNLTSESINNNEELVAEIAANVAFYSFLKEEFYKSKQVKEAIETGFPVVDAMISFFGGIKDFLTSTDFGKYLAKKVKQFTDKFFPTLGKDPESWPNKFVAFTKKLASALGPKGIAWLLAAKKAGKEAGGIAKFLKFKKPSKEQVEAALPIATKIYKGLMLILIGIATIKLLAFIAPFFKASMAASIKASLLGAAQQAGISGFTLAGFNILGLTKKIQHYKHAEHLGDHSEEINGELNSVVTELGDLADTFS